MHRRSRRHPGLVAFAVLWLTAALARAQTTTGAIDGVVRDPDKNPVPGVLVVSNSPSLIQKDLTVSTGQDGYYRLPALPPGTYAVSFRLPGFQTIERTGLIVTTGQTTSVDVELRLATIEETVTVVGASPTIDPRSAKLAFTYTRSLLENVPAVRNFHTMLYTMPGVEPNASAVGKVSAGTANYDNVLGGGLFANWYKFDGANATDPRVGSNQTQLFSYDIIDEVQVLKGGKPAEVGFAYGGFFQIVTKSGGNDFHGVGAVYYQDDAIQSDNVNDRLRQAGVRLTDRLVDSYDASASMGGRFVRDKLWWFGSARRQEQTLQVFGLPDPQEDRIKAFFWKNTYQPRPRHTLTGMVNHWDESVNPYPFGSAALLGERQATMITTPGGEAVNGRWKGTLTDTVMVDAGVAYSKESFERVDQPDSGIAIFDLVTGRRFRNRGIFYSTIPSWNWHSNGSLSWFVPDAAGRHDFKFGAEYTHGVVPSTFEQIGDHQLTLSNGLPSQVWIYNTPVDQHLDLYLTSAFAQDAWTIRNRLTLNLGARYDRAVGRLQDAPAGGGRFANTSLADRYPVLKRQT
ncbi:MAG: TonB-dependent receptor, partial [Acidobacteria bacterium]|nr:TonB-dependent receptor [Acidobacteriota bacterium]